jgi:hypothetical protein
MDELHLVLRNRKINLTFIDHQARKKNIQDWILCIGMGLFITAAILILLFSCDIQPARAETIDIEKLATAIYYAENSKTHPYGILAHYEHTSPRQACINTINHALRDWDGKGDFIVFLGNRYCPIGASNDPKGLNKNWVRNVKYFLEKND